MMQIIHDVLDASLLRLAPGDDQSTRRALEMLYGAGLKGIGEDLRVLDIGCGYHEFRGKIDNIIGIDPYNYRADIMVKLLDYHPEERFDAVLALGSINFGSTDKIFAELEHAVSLCNPGAVLFFRANPGLPHDRDESSWISFYPWDANFVVNCANQLGVDILDLRTDSHKNRLYFVWRTK